jgi:heat-inducible transcriptional repressor
MGACTVLSDRQKLILSAIVDDYVRSAEPVGSRSISKRGDVIFSPATIRNEMSDLEELGYLEQPHTSAGRIPSHKGYRYYVDHLMQSGTFSPQDLNVIKRFFAEKMQEMEYVIQQVATALSSLTNYTSIVLGPEVFSTSLRHVQLVPLNDRNAVAIIVTSTGHVENRMIEIPEGISVADMEKTFAILNAKLKDVPLIQLKSKLYSEVAQELGKYVNGYESLVQILESVFENDEHDRLFMSGATKMLVQPEFKDVDKVKGILELLEETPTLVRMISSAPEGIQVRIGSENTLQAMANCSLITASYSIEGQNLGAIGIIGPTRMEYGKMISLLDHLSRDLSILLSRWYK